MHPYRPEAYTPDKLDVWIDIATRQAPKDRLLIPRMLSLLNPGPVLELGSGTGHIAKIIESTGRQVIASDFAGFFVDYMQKSGLNALQIDATSILDAGRGSFANIFSHSITPFVTDDEAVERETYRSSYEALVPGGKMVMLHAMAARSDLTRTMRFHAAICASTGFSDIALRRDQLLPTEAYLRAPKVSMALENLLGAHLGSRFVLSAMKSAKAAR